MHRLISISRRMRASARTRVFDVWVYKGKCRAFVEFYVGTLETQRLVKKQSSTNHFGDLLSLWFLFMFCYSPSVMYRLISISRKMRAPTRAFDVWCTKKWWTRDVESEQLFTDKRCVGIVFVHQFSTIQIASTCGRTNVRNARALASVCFCVYVHLCEYTGCVWTRGGGFSRVCECVHVVEGFLLIFVSQIVKRCFEPKKKSEVCECGSWGRFELRDFFVRLVKSGFTVQHIRNPKRCARSP